MRIPASPHTGLAQTGVPAVHVGHAEPGERERPMASALIIRARLSWSRLVAGAQPASFVSIHAARRVATVRPAALLGLVVSSAATRWAPFFLPRHRATATDGAISYGPEVTECAYRIWLGR